MLRCCIQRSVWGRRADFVKHRLLPSQPRHVPMPIFDKVHRALCFQMLHATDNALLFGQGDGNW